MTGDETRRIRVECEDCGASYVPATEGPEDHAEDCDVRRDMISIGRWDDPDDGGDPLVADGGVDIVTACRECDSAELEQRDPRSPHSPYDEDDPLWLCCDCGHEMEEPVRRESREHGPQRGPAKELFNAESGDLVTDGGLVHELDLEESPDEVLIGEMVAIEYDRGTVRAEILEVETSPQDDRQLVVKYEETGEVVSVYPNRHWPDVELVGGEA